MDSKAEWMLRVLGVDVRQDRSSAGAERDELIRAARRLTALRPRIEALPNQFALSALLHEATEAIKSHSPALASEHADALEARVASAERAAAAAAAISSARPSATHGLVDFAKLRLKLSAALQARNTAAVNLQHVCERLLSSGDYDDDPEYSAALMALPAVGNRLPRIDPLADQVQDALDALANVDDPSRRQALLGPVVSAIDSFMAMLDADEMFRTLQETDAGTLPIYDAIAGAVTSLRTALAG